MIDLYEIKKKLHTYAEAYEAYQALGSASPSAELATAYKKARAELQNEMDDIISWFYRRVNRYDF